MGFRLAAFAKIGGIALIVAVLSSCSEPLSPVAQRHMRTGTVEKDYESCPPGAEMPGGWCLDEFETLSEAIFGIQGDSTCDRMRNTIDNWLWNGTIVKYTDFDQSTGAMTYWDPRATFSSRHDITQLNASVPAGIYQQNMGLTPGQVLRHEYAHVFYNSVNEDSQTVEGIINSCGGGGQHNMGGLGSPAPPVI